MQTFGHKGFMAPSRGTGGRQPFRQQWKGLTRRPRGTVWPPRRAQAEGGRGRGRAGGRRPHDARGRWRQGGRREAVGLLPCVDAARRAWRRLRCECAVGGGAAWLRFRPGRRGGRTGRSTLCSRRLGPARPSRAPCRLQEGPASHSGLSLGRVSRSCEIAPAVPQFAVRRVRSVSVRLLSDAFDAFQRRSQMLTHLSSDCGVSVVS